MVDASLRMSIVNLFSDLKEEYNVTVYITYDLATAYYIRRIAIMLRGDVVEFQKYRQSYAFSTSPLHPNIVKICSPTRSRENVERKI